MDIANFTTQALPTYVSTFKLNTPKFNIYIYIYIRGKEEIYLLFESEFSNPNIFMSVLKLMSANIQFITLIWIKG